MNLSCWPTHSGNTCVLFKRKDGRSCHRLKNERVSMLLGHGLDVRH
jgi:hypothetical protein